MSNPGDKCRILDNFEVEHWECDEHPDGTVTDALSGEVKRRRESTTRERIEKGAAWLDKVKPEWRSLIDTETLDMRAGDVCVLGQVFATAATEAGISNGYSYAYHEANEASYQWAIDHGFESGGEDYSTLRAAWLDFLSEEG